MSTDSTRLLAPGRPANFVRWIRGKDRWYPEILRGHYQGTTEHGWNVRVDGQIVYLDEGMWAVYR